jgi:hypothetical protein
MSEAEAADRLEEDSSADRPASAGEAARRAGNLLSHGYH